MRRVWVMLCVCTLGLGAVGCEGKKEDGAAEAPKDRGNIKEGRPAESTMGKRVQDAQKVQDTLNKKYDEMDKEMPE